MSQIGSMVEITDGGNYTAESGIDRIVAFILICGAGTVTNEFSSVSFGAQDATIVNQINDGAELSGLAIVREADIPAGVYAVNVVMTEDGSEEGVTIHCITLGNRNQGSSPISNTGASDGLNWTGTLAAVPAGSDVVVAISSGVPSRYPVSSAAPFTLLDGGNKGLYSGGSLLAQGVTAGDASFNATFNSSDGGSWTIAAFQVAGGTVTVSPESLNSGDEFTLTYSDFDATPTSPVSLTDTPPDGGTENTITIPVTISDTESGGKHSGTAVGTMPDLPSSGSVSAIRFGTFTFELSS